MNKIILAVGITILFLGVSINTAIAVNPITSGNEEDCNICPKVSNLHLVRLKSLINRVETLNNKLSVVFKHIPKVAERYQELSDRITILTEMNTGLKPDKDYPIICDILLMVFITSSLKFLFLEFFTEIVYPIMGKITKLYFIDLFWFINFYKAFFIIFSIAPYFDCKTLLDFPEKRNI